MVCTSAENDYFSPHPSSFRLPMHLQKPTRLTLFDIGNFIKPLNKYLRFSFPLFTGQSDLAGQGKTTSFFPDRLFTSKSGLAHQKPALASPHLLSAQLFQLSSADTIITTPRSSESTPWQLTSKISPASQAQPITPPGNPPSQPPS